ncbi:MAG: T9SS type A sorting domain-containing protein [Acidobacteriota bacterium]
MKTLLVIIAIFILTSLQLGQVIDKVPSHQLNKSPATKASTPGPGIISSEKNIWDILELENLPSTTSGVYWGIIYLNTSNEIWMSRWDSGELFILALSNKDNPVSYITIKDVNYVTAMTFDGTYIYACNSTADIMVIDPATKTRIGTINAPQEVLYVTYDPKADGGKGGLWVGNFSSDPQLINKNGVLLGALNYADLGTTGICGAAYDGQTSGGPYLWFFGEGYGYGYPQTISQVNISTKKATSLQRDIRYDLEAFANKNGKNVNVNNIVAGGLCLITGAYPGKVALGGIMESNPDIIFTVEIGTAYAPPSAITLDRSFTFGDPKISSSYRIVSLPGDVNIPLSQVFADAGEHKKNWNAFYDNGKTENYLIEYNNSSDFTFKPGNAFWVVSKNEIKVSGQVNPVSTDGTFKIPLHNGWNLISSPLESSISWASVEAENQLPANSLIYSWNGSWSNPASLIKYEGYYFYNADNLPSLKLPATVPVGISASSLNKKALYNPDKYLKGYLYSDGKELSPFYVSINKRASEGFDDFDYFTPPSDFSDECIYILNKNLRTDYKHLFIDSRPEISDGQVYDLVLKNVSKKPGEIRFEGIENFAGYEVCLADNYSKRFYNLRENPAVNIEPAAGKRELSLIIGKSSFIEEKKNNLTPKDFALFQNYPNPFNPYTIISYELPKETRVELKVFDMLGKEIITLKDGVEAPGRHEVKFDAGRLPSGIYFYTLKSGGFTKTEKMVVLK